MTDLLTLQLERFAQEAEQNLAQRSAWRLGVSGAFWQTSFWDHFFRPDEQLETLLNYVLDNAVRAGLVSQRSDYHFCGSFVAGVGDTPAPCTAGDEPPPYGR